ncbi:MAG: twin-arginine translocation signal domain-containing protein, partial [Planctomycetaceae bacterium]|nr:twin-arginine translocation signal domain-containing protein [Planctomycetaceae bacterium]
MSLEKLSLHGRRLLDRRGFLGTAGLSAAGLGLASLLNTEGLLAEDPATVSGESPIRPE